MNNMIKSDKSLEYLQKLFSVIPNKNCTKLHDVINVEFRKTWGLPVRKVDDFILAYIRAGSGYYDLNGTTVPIEKGRIVLISPTLTHSAAQYEQTPSLISIRFGVYENTRDEYINLPCPPLFLSLIPRQQEYFLKQFEQINRYNSMKVINRSNNVSINRICNSFLNYLLDELMLEISEISKNISLDMRLESARNYIEKNIHQQITIDALASIAGLSLPYFSKLFKKQYGITPQNYIFNNKMNYAFSLLSQSHLTVKEVSEILCYSDPFIFSNQFKSFFGFPPSKVKI